MAAPALPNRHTLKGMAHILTANGATSHLRRSAAPFANCQAPVQVGVGRTGLPIWGPCGAPLYAGKPIQLWPYFTVTSHGACTHRP
jgi:hypothetical protein